MQNLELKVSGCDSGTVADSGRHPCMECRQGDGNNSSDCKDCKFWVHRKCSDIWDSLN